MYKLLTLAFALVVTGCHSEGLETGDSAPPMGGSPVDTAESAGAEDTGPSRYGLLGRSGTAVVGEDSYSGTEELYFTSEYGEGDDLCRIRYSLSYVATRTDCDDCEWAFDLVLTDPELVTEVGKPDCLSTVGVDSSALDTLNNTTVSYGYNPDYIGHVQVLFVETDSGWVPADHCSWDASAGALSYDWKDGYHTY